MDRTCVRPTAAASARRRRRRPKKPPPVLSMVMTLAATLPWPLPWPCDRCHTPRVALAASVWYSDPSGVLEDLNDYSALYVKAHGCVWSEYGIDNYDDDGENRDGEDGWYLGRTLPFRANVAYSLYGIKRGQFRLFHKCAKSTYINTFTTFMGADTLLDAVGQSYAIGGDGDDDDVYSGYGNAGCTQTYAADVDWLSDDGDSNVNIRRKLGSGDNDDGDLLSTTMGCAVNGREFVVAAFGDGYCSGGKFLNATTDGMTTYNGAVDGVRCEKVLDADGLLGGSSACDSYYYGDRCPDPYGKKRKHAREEASASTGGGGQGARRFFLRAFRGLAWILFVSGLLLLAFAFWIARRHPRRRRGRKKGASGRRKRDDKRRSSSRGDKRKSSTKSRMRRSRSREKGQLDGQDGGVPLSWDRTMSTDDGTTPTGPSVNKNLV